MSQYVYLSLENCEDPIAWPVVNLEFRDNESSCGPILHATNLTDARVELLIVRDLPMFANPPEKNVKVVLFIPPKRVEEFFRGLASILEFCEGNASLTSGMMDCVQHHSERGAQRDRPI